MQSPTSAAVAAGGDLSERFERVTQVIVDLAWGPQLVLLLIGAGVFFTLFSRLLPFRRIGHGFAVLRGDYDSPDDPGEISHFQALSTALASTIGVGNIGGVALAISQGGPGAVFWMWVAALVGMGTKFFTCTLAVLFRGHDSLGRLQGGPMYYIEEGLGRRFKPLAYLFAAFGIIGCLPMFQANQLSEILYDGWSVPAWITGGVCALLVSSVAFGGVARIGRLTSRLVPSMCFVYLIAALVIVAMNIDAAGAVLAQILSEAFTGRAAIGGAEGVAVSQVIMIGVKRAAFSNEAGIGTAPLAHGAARTNEPVREGLVAMLGPFLDTIVVCTLTAIVVLTGANWQGAEIEGVALTNEAFVTNFGITGQVLLTIIVTLFAVSTMVGYSYYGRKCFGYLFGARRETVYGGIYIVGTFLGAVWSASTVINIIDTAFAMMTVPNLIAALVLAPAVMKAAREYFSREHIPVNR